MSQRLPGVWWNLRGAGLGLGVIQPWWPPSSRSSSHRAVILKLWVAGQYQGVEQGPRESYPLSARHPRSRKSVPSRDFYLQGVGTRLARCQDLTHMVRSHILKLARGLFRSTHQNSTVSVLLPWTRVSWLCMLSDQHATCFSSLLLAEEADAPPLHPFLPQGDHEGDEGVQEWAEGPGGC